jgi:HEAT repeat protein
MLPKVNDLGVKEGIVRALSVKEAAPMAAKPLLEEFRKLLGDEEPAGVSARWAIANALTVVAKSESVEDVLHLITLPSSGSARKMLALTLGKLKDPRAVPILIDLLNDDQVVGHAASALGMMKAAAARPHLLKLANYPMTWVRKEAEKAILKIDGKPVTKKARLKIN